MDLDSLLKSIREENKGGAIVPAKFFGEDRYEKYAAEMAKNGTLDGDKLTREERIEGVRAYRRGKIDFETFVNKVLNTRDEIKKQEQKDSNSSLSESATSSIVKSDSLNIEKFKPEPLSEQTQQNFDDILSGIDSILETLREENTLAKDKSDADRLKEEERKRKAQETNLEKPFEKLGGIVGAVLKPVKSLWEKIWNFIWNVFLGRTVIKLFEWFSKDENKKSLEAIGVFLKNTWPAILAAFLVFGTGLGGFIKGIVGLTTKFIPKIVKMVAKLAKSAVKFAISNPLAALAIAGGVATVAGLAQQATSKSNDEERAKEGKTQLDDTQEFGGISGDPMGGLFSGGGGVPGTGNKDTVPAMLTPGEFVMSKGAVQKYGMDTMESMNAMGGGTNLPERMNGITYASGGGMIGGGDEEKKEKMPSEHKSIMDRRKNRSGSGTKSGSSNLIGEFFGSIKKAFGFGEEDKNKSSGGGGFGEDSLKKAMDDAGYTDKTERAMFLAQMAHESGNFKYDEEIASGESYEGRKDLGNTEPGDGVKYKGRGYIQLTGRANYEHYGNKLGVDLVGEPDLAKKPDIAAKIAVAYWNERVDRNAARSGDVLTVTRNINGGTNGLEDRRNKFRNYMEDPDYKIPSAGDGISSASSGGYGGGYGGGSSVGGYGDMKSSTVLARKGGVEGRLDKSTGKWTAGDWSKKDRSRYMKFGGNAKKTAPPPPQRSKSPVTSISSMGSKNSSGGGYESESSGIDNSKPSHSVPRDRSKAKTLGVLI